MSYPIDFTNTMTVKAAVVPFVLATPHHAAPEVVAQIDQAVVVARHTGYCGATSAPGQSAVNATRAPACAPKLPPLQ